MKYQLTVNGQPQAFEGTMPSTLAGLLDYLKVDQATVVAEVDGAIVERRDFAQTPLREGQAIELIRFVGGG